VLKVVLEVLEVLAGVRCVPLCMLETVEGVLCLLDAVEGVRYVLELLEVVLEVL